MKDAQKKPVAIVVNDDPPQLLMLARLLEKAGFESASFLSVTEALNGIAGKTPPAIVVTDLYMPEIDGWRFCRLLRSPEYKAFNTTPILVVSATFSGDEPARLVAELGATAFLPMPVDGKKFIETVNAIFKRSLPPRKRKVLLVEDDKQMLRLLKTIFGRHNYDVVEAGALRAAKEIFNTRVFEVSVIDYHLPDGNGDTLLKYFKARQPDCVNIMITGDSSSDLALKWMQLGSAAYICKPFSSGYLIEICDRALRERALMRVEDILEKRTKLLRESEEKNRLIVEQTMFGIATHEIILDTAGRPVDYVFLSVNPAFETLTGLKAADILGRRATEVLLDIEKNRFIRIYGQMMLSGNPVSFEHYYESLKRHYYITAHRMGETRCATIFSDITQRKRMEKEILRLDTMAKKDVALGLHDSVAQPLAAAGCLCNALNSQLQNVSQKKMLKEIENGLCASLEHIRQLSKGLFPVGLETEGLLFILRQLAKNLSGAYPVNCRVEVSGDCPADFGGENAVHLYYLAHEAAMNAVRHANPRNIIIACSSEELTVSDDGEGFDTSLSGEHGMGLHIMEYRANIIGGILDIESRKGKGTTVKLKLPSSIDGL